MTIHVASGVAAINPSALYGMPGKWVAWDIYGPVRETESRTPQAALRKYKKLIRDKE